jgi:hypothetical protein
MIHRDEIYVYRDCDDIANTIDPGYLPPRKTFERRLCMPCSSVT